MLPVQKERTQHPCPTTYTPRFFSLSFSAHLCTWGCPWLQAPPCNLFVGLGPRFPLSTSHTGVLVFSPQGLCTLCSSCLDRPPLSYLRSSLSHLLQLSSDIASPLSPSLAISSALCLHLAPACFLPQFPSLRSAHHRQMCVWLTLSLTYCQTISPLKAGLSVCFIPCLRPQGLQQYLALGKCLLIRAV